MGLDSIAMIKISSRISYGYEGHRLNIKQIYAKNKKRRGLSKYLLSVDVTVGKGTDDEPSIPARIVCVRNRSNKKDWLAIIFTRYMYLSVYQRKDQDKRTIGEIFYVLLSEMEDVTFQHY